MRSRCYSIRPIYMVNAYIKEFKAKETPYKPMVCACVSASTLISEKEKKKNKFICCSFSSINFTYTLWFECNPWDCYFSGPQKEYAVKFLLTKWIDGDRLEINESKWIWAICIDSEIYCNKIVIFSFSFIGNRPTDGKRASPILYSWASRMLIVASMSVLAHRGKYEVRHQNNDIMAAQKWKWNITFDLYYFIFTLTRKDITLYAASGSFYKEQMQHIYISKCILYTFTVNILLLHTRKKGIHMHHRHHHLAALNAKTASKVRWQWQYVHEEKLVQLLYECFCSILLFRSPGATHRMPFATEILYELGMFAIANLLVGLINYALLCLATLCYSSTVHMDE